MPNYSFFTGLTTPQVNKQLLSGLAPNPHMHIPKLIQTLIGHSNNVQLTPKDKTID